jgi:hypothetical protein
MFNQCLSPLKLWVRIQLRRGVINTTLCDKVCQWLEAGLCFSLVSSTNKTDRQDIPEILLKVVLNTITNPNPAMFILLSLFCHQKAFIDPAIVLSMFMLSIIFVIPVVCGLFEWNNIGKVFLSYVYICIAVGDTVIKIGGLGSN